MLMRQRKEQLYTPLKTMGFLQFILKTSCRICPVLLLCFLGIEGFSQELGLPPFRYFSPNQYEAGSRNWSLVADSTGVIYVANEEGLLRYDGVTWMKTELPQKQIAYWVETDNDGKIYVGANGDFGVVQFSEEGGLFYESLLTRLDSQYHDFNVVWEIARDKWGVVFRSRKYLFRLIDDEITTFQVPEGGSKFDVAFSVRDTVYLRVYDLGLAYVAEDGVRSLPNSAFFAEKKVNGIYPYGRDRLLIATRYEGLYIYDAKQGATPFTTNADEYLLENKIYDGHYLENGNYALATMANGVVVLTPEGKEVFRFDSSNGLKNNQTLYVREVNGQLWLGTKNGIFQLAYNAPFKAVEDEFGLNGQVSGIFRYDESLFVTCNDGFYQLSDQQGFPEFERINEDVIVDCVNLFEMGNAAWLSSLDGIFEYQDGTLQKKSAFSPREIVRTSREDVFLSSEFYFGLHLLTYSGGQFENRPVLSIDRYIDQIIPAGNDLFHVKTIDNQYYAVQLDFSTEEVSATIINESALPVGVQLIRVGDEVGFVSRDSLYFFEAGEINPKSYGLQFQRKPQEIVLTAPLSGDYCLICYEDELKSFFCEKFKLDEGQRLSSSGEYVYTAFEPTAVYENPDNQNLWIGGATGIRVFKSTAGDEKPLLQEGQTLIRQMYVGGDSTIFTGLDQLHSLKFDENK